MAADFSHPRITYDRSSLDDDCVAPEPLAQFRAWFEEAQSGDIREPHAMTLATVGDGGRPSARIVLLRGWGPGGFVFFTNYESRKGGELARTPLAALLFYWAPLERQVRIEGAVERLSAEDSDAYFAARPRGHRLSAWASRQSSAVADRATLERAMAECEARFGDEAIPRPPYWGGYRVLPARFEFWQGRPNRVHDRIEYRRAGDAWSTARLSP